MLNLLEEASHEVWIFAPGSRLEAGAEVDAPGLGFKSGAYIARMKAAGQK
jgi:hypothetical protein